MVLAAQNVHSVGCRVAKLLLRDVNFWLALPGCAQSWEFSDASQEGRAET